MRLSKEEKKLCEKYGERDESGHVRCHECPMAIDKRYALCKRTATAKEWHEHIKGEQP
mgnify:CR=1 FL=1